MIEPLNPELAPAVDLGAVNLFAPQHPQQPQQPEGTPAPPTILSTPSFDAAVSQAATELAGAYQAQQDFAIRKNLAAALVVDPAKAGEAQQIAQSLGVPVDTAADNIDVLREMWRQKQASDARFSQSHPVLASLLQDVNFTTVAQDDLDHLAGTETAFQRIKLAFQKASLQNDLGLIGTRLMLGGDNEVDLRRAQWLRSVIEQMPAQSGLLEGTANLLGSMAAPLAISLSAGAAASGLASLGGPISSATAGAVATGVSIFTTTAVTEAGNAFLDMVDPEGLNLDRAAAVRAAVGVGLVNGALELVGEELSFGLARGLGKTSRLFTKRVGQEIAAAVEKRTFSSAAVKFATRYALGVAGEVTTETLQEVSNVIGESYARGETPGAGPGPTSAEVKARLEDIAAQTAVGMVLLGGVGPMGRFFAEARIAGRSRASGKVFSEIAKGATKSKLAKHNPDALERFIARNVDGTPIENVYLNGEDVQQVLQQLDTNPEGEDRAPERQSALDSLDAEVPGFKEQLQAAVATGGDVVLPTATFARLAGEGRVVAAGLTPHVRLNPEDLSPAQLANVDLQTLAKDAEKLLGDEADLGKQRAKEAEQARKEFVSGLTPTAKLSSQQIDSASRIYRDWLVVNAARAGLPVAEFQKQFGMRWGKLEGEAATAAVSAAQGRARYAASLRLGEQQPNADVSSIVHEMGHHFAFFLFNAAGNPEAPGVIHSDAVTLLDWFAANGAPLPQEKETTVEQKLAAWNGLSIEQQRSYHEALAYNWERFLLEGVAPSPRLKLVFERLRDWIVQVYRSWAKIGSLYEQEFKTPLPELSEEVRAVFGRMVAADELVQKQQESLDLVPLFQTKEEFTKAGHSEQDWNEYQQAVTEAHFAATTDVQTATMKQLRWLKAARSKVLQQLITKNAKLRKATEAQVRAEVQQERVYLVMEQLRSAAGGGKLSLDAVRAVVTRMVEGELRARSLTGNAAEEIEARVKKLGVGKRGVLAKAGVDPELVATQLGYANGDEMVREMVAAEPLQDRIDRETTHRLMSEHGDLHDQAQLEAAANKALHRMAMARALATELRILLGVQSLSVNTILLGARVAARKHLEQRTLREISPQKFMAAERLASRAAAKASAAGKIPEAIKWKRLQLLNHLLAAESYATAEETAKAAREFKRVLGKDSQRAKDTNFDLIQAARWILSTVGLAPRRLSERAATYVDLLQRYDPALLAGLRPVLDAARSRKVKDYRDLKLSEFRLLRADVQSLWTRARTEQQILVRDKILQADEAAATLAGTLPDTETVAGETSALDWWQRMQRKILGTKANLTRVEHLFRAMGKPWTDLLLTGLRSSLNEYRSEAASVIEKLVNGVRSLNLPRGEIEAHELRYTFGNGASGHGLAELVGLLLHLGNDGNRERVLVAGRGPGHSWVRMHEDGSYDTVDFDRFLQRMIDEGILTQAHFDFVQGVWDLLEGIKPTLQEASRQLQGKYFVEVQAQPFTITFKDGSTKTYRGGYVPATADRDLVPTFRSMSPQERENEFRAGLPSVPAGYLKERVEGYRKRPLALNVGMIAQHVDEVIRYAHVQPRVNDVLKVLNRENLANKLNRMNPELMRTVILPWIDRAVSQSLYEPGKDPTASALWRFIRVNNGVAIMFGNVVNSLQQVIGLSNSLIYGSPKHLFHALVDYIKDRRTIVGDTITASEFMDDRLRNQMFGLTTDLRDLLQDPSGFAKLQRLSGRWGYVMQATAQNFVDIITWNGKFREVLETRNEGETAAEHQQRAVDEADAAVRLSQGSFNPEDVANYEVGTPFYRTWVQFTSYFNVVLNQIGFAKKGTKLRTAFLAFTIPMVLGEALARSLWRQWDADDDDGLAKDAFAVFLGSQIRGAASFIPAWGPAAENLFEQVFTNRPLGDKVVSSPAASALTRSFLGTLQAIAAGADADKRLTGKNARDVMTLLSLLSGVPLSAIGKPVGYGLDVATGRVRPSGPVDATFGFLTGRAGAGTQVPR